MNASQLSQSLGVNPTNTSSVDAPETTPTARKTTGYDRNFAQDLTDHHVYRPYSPDEPDLEEIMAAIKARRPSLSPSNFDRSAMRGFQESATWAHDEDDVLATVIPTIIGPNHTMYATARNATFVKLDPLTDGTIPSAKPDLYDGARSEERDRSVRNELAGHMLRSTRRDKPMVPSFSWRSKARSEAML